MFENFAKPTIAFCEPNTLSIIAQPANSWSNISFVLVGIYLILLSRKERNLLLKLLGPMAIFIAICSFFYHATYTFVGQFLDLGSMFLLSTYLLVFNLHRLNTKIFTIKKSAFLFGCFVCICLLLVYFVRPANFTLGVPIFGIQIGSFLVLESKLFRKSEDKYKIKNLLIALGLFIAAFAFWNLDYLRIWCDPHTFHLINGHAIWHIMNSLVFIFLYYFYKQFNDK